MRCLEPFTPQEYESRRNPSESDEKPGMQPPDDDFPELEIALLRSGVGRRDAGQERCCGCQRTPLVGETVYVRGHGEVFCELCRALEADPPRESRVVHGPEFGHTMKLTDRRHRAA